MTLGPTRGYCLIPRARDTAIRLPFPFARPAIPTRTAMLQLGPIVPRAAPATHRKTARLPR